MLFVTVAICRTPVSVMGDRPHLATKTTAHQRCVMRDLSQYRWMNNMIKKAIKKPRLFQKEKSIKPVQPKQRFSKIRQVTSSKIERMVYDDER